MGKQSRKRRGAKHKGDEGVTLFMTITCSGLVAPAHLRPEHGYVYPLQNEEEPCACSNTCPFARCITYPPPGGLDMEDPQTVREWTYCMCYLRKCDPDDLFRSLSGPDHVPLPDNVVVRPNKPHPLVYAFLVSTDDKRSVHVFNVTCFPVSNGRRAFQLPQVAHVGRRAAFGQLSEAIEASADSLTSAQYKALYDAAMAVRGAP